jgi:uncharacterized repeat protein (TIGR03803 family)
MKPNRHRIVWLGLCAIVGLSATLAEAQELTILHRFAGYDTDGAGPQYGPLALYDGYLYGTTEHGGSQLTGGTYMPRGGGTVFRIGTDGTGYEMLHDFQLSPTDGLYPKGQPIVVNGRLYGMTNLGGSDGAGGTAGGTVYAMDLDGDNFELLHSFNGGAGDGSLPYTEPAAGTDGGVDYLYGMTKGGGAYGKGVIFRIATDGTSYSNLHEFNGGNSPGDDPDDGREPWGSVTLHDDMLYGMTRHGGDDDKGTLFRMNTDGSGYTRLHEFGYPPEGQQPFGRPIVYNNQLYGMCINGGNVNPAWGIVYRCDLNGDNYQIIHHFEGDPDGGRQPHGQLLELNGMLYGMSLWGGEFGRGDIFTIDPATGEYTNLHSFTAWDSPDGADPVRLADHRRALPLRHDRRRGLWPCRTAATAA